MPEDTIDSGKTINGFVLASHTSRNVVKRILLNN
jgi:hypothetical protein